MGLSGRRAGESIRSRENIMCKGSEVGLSIAGSGTVDRSMLLKYDLCRTREVADRRW